jgi:hypothetical protein
MGEGQNSNTIVPILPTATATATPTISPTPKNTPLPTYTPSPNPSCAIKGNVNRSGDKIYHVPGGAFYDRTDINPEEGDGWFCTEAEAQAAGFRRSAR